MENKPQSKHHQEKRLIYKYGDDIQAAINECHTKDLWLEIFCTTNNIIYNRVLSFNTIDNGWEINITLIEHE